METNRQRQLIDVCETATAPVKTGTRYFFGVAIRPSKYKRHQGVKECQRRVRQMA